MFRGFFLQAGSVVVNVCAILRLKSNVYTSVCYLHPILEGGWGGSGCWLSQYRDPYQLSEKIETMIQPGYYDIDNELRGNGYLNNLRVMTYKRF